LFRSASEESAFLLGEYGTPRDCIDGLLKICDCFDKCLIVKNKPTFATGTGNVDTTLQPSDLFMRYLTAIRTRDWPQVRIIEHDIRS
jgi:hypothetical protein